MATNHRKPVTEAQEWEAPKSEPPKAPESTYTIAELAEAHNIFDTSYEIVAVALKLAKKERVAVEEARKIIENFKNKEVK